MQHQNTVLSKVEPIETGAQSSRERGLLIGALGLLVLALVVVLWRDSDFWFTDFWFSDAPAAKSARQIAGDRPGPTKARARTAPHSSALKAGSPKSSEQNEVAQNGTDPSAPGSAAVSVGARTVLPPLEVEVVAGNSRRIVHPGNRSLRIEMQPKTPATDAVAQRNAENETTAALTSQAAESVRMSGNTDQIVAAPVRPNYPLLARRMKVQGSVVLDALIGKDGEIQNLRLVSGPQILASAAEDAVRQWRFKPHFEGSEVVETETRITVNFTISTN